MQWLWCVEFWINRYQTLIAAAVALIGVYWAIRPAWRQVMLMERQAAQDKRERLAALYRMFTNAMQILNFEDWKAQMEFFERPAHEDLQGVEIRPALKAAFDDRKARWQEIVANLKAELPHEDFIAIKPELDMVDGRFEQCENELTADNQVNRSDRSSQYWFNAAWSPDLMVAYRMDKARKILEERAAGVVDEMTKTG